MADPAFSEHIVHAVVLPATTHEDFTVSPPRVIEMSAMVSGKGEPAYQLLVTDLYEAATYLLAHTDNDPDSGLDAGTYQEAWNMIVKAVARAAGDAEGGQA